MPPIVTSAEINRPAAEVFALARYIRYAKPKLIEDGGAGRCFLTACGLMNSQKE
jgi:hypothetical protein